MGVNLSDELDILRLAMIYQVQRMDLYSEFQLCYYFNSVALFKNIVLLSVFIYIFCLTYVNLNYFFIICILFWMYTLNYLLCMFHFQFYLHQIDYLSICMFFMKMKLIKNFCHFRRSLLSKLNSPVVFCHNDLQEGWQNQKIANNTQLNIINSQGNLFLVC